MAFPFDFDAILAFDGADVIVVVVDLALGLADNEVTAARNNGAFVDSGSADVNRGHQFRNTQT